MVKCDFIRKLKRNSNISLMSLMMFIIFGFLSTYALSWVLPIGYNRLALNNSLFSLLCWFLFTILFKICFRRMTCRSLVCSGLLGTFFALCLIFGCQISQYDKLLSFRPGFFWGFVGAFLFCTAVLNRLLFFALDVCSSEEKRESLFPSLFVPCRRNFFLTWAILFLCWIPCLLALWPGVYAYDGPNQLAQVFVGKVYDAHQPVLHTWFIAMCFRLGHRIGSDNAGMAIYSIFQMIVLSFALAWICYTLCRHSAPHLVQAVTFLLFAFFPMVPTMAVSTTKDIPFVAALAVFLCLSWDLVMDASAFFHTPLKIVCFLLCAFAIIALRSNGIYFLTFAAVFYILFIKGHRLPVLLLCVTYILFSFLLTGPIYQSMHVIPVDFREALSIPVQQVARVCRDQPNKITPAEREIINRAITPKAQAHYSPRLSDPVKGGVNTQYLRAHKRLVLRVYCSLGKRCPGTYLEAFLCNSLGFWYTDTDYQSKSVWIPTSYIEFSEKTHMPANWCHVTRQSVIPGLEEFYEGVALRQTVNSIPGFSMLMNCGFPVWILLTCIMLCIFRKQYHLLPLFAVLFGFWGTLLLSPAVLFRYGFPLFICVPLAIGLAFSRKKDVEASLPQDAKVCANPADI